MVVWISLCKCIGYVNIFISNEEREHLRLPLLKTLSQWAVPHFSLFPNMIPVQSCLVRSGVDEAVCAFDSRLILWNKQ